jgi:hypothetical protein
MAAAAFIHRLGQQSLLRSWRVGSLPMSNWYASGGPAPDRNSEDELQPGRYVMRSPPPGELARFSIVLTADICVASQSRCRSSFIIPRRTRAYSVNCTYTPHVRFWLLFLRLRRLLTNTLGDAVRNTNQRTRWALLYYGSTSCW